MHIIKLDATDSTNTYLKNLRQSEELVDMTTVVAFEQRNGRGQVGAIWESEPGKNLTFSVLKKLDAFSVDRKFVLNVCASLAIVDCLEQYKVPDVRIKWPNDILSGSNKICGILIENMLLGNHIKTAIIGVGLNVNQIVFETVAKISSLKLLLGEELNLNDLLDSLLYCLRQRFDQLKTSSDNGLWDAYSGLLFRKNELSLFENPEGEQFKGTILDVSLDGRLRVQLENSDQKEYDLKEIRLLY